MPRARCAGERTAKEAEMDEKPQTARDITKLVREVNQDSAITDDRIDSLDWRLAKLERRLIAIEEAIRNEQHKSRNIWT